MNRIFQLQQKMYSPRHKQETLSTKPGFQGGRDNLVKILVDTIDFNSQHASVNAIKFIYTVVIAGRMLSSRDTNELNETCVRDIPGWLSWFYVSPAVANGVGYLLNKRSKNKAGNPSDWVDLVMKPGAAKTKSFYEAIAPWKPDVTMSFTDIDNLKGSISKHNFDSLQKNRAVAFVVSLVAAIGALGLLIPWLNTQTTRRRVMKTRHNNNPSLLITPKTDQDLSHQSRNALRERTIPTNKLIVNSYDIVS